MMELHLTNDTLKCNKQQIGIQSWNVYIWELRHGSDVAAIDLLGHSASHISEVKDWTFELLSCQSVREQKDN